MVMVMVMVMVMNVSVVMLLDEAELSFLNSLVSFAHELLALKLSDTELALICALVLVNPSEC